MKNLRLGKKVGIISALMLTLLVSACSSNTNETVQPEITLESVEAFDKDIKNNSMAISTDETIAVVSNSEYDTVKVYDLATKAIKKELTSFVTPRNIAFSVDGNSFYISDSSHGAILEYDTDTLELIRKMDLAKGVFGFTIIDNNMFVNNQAEDTVTVLDLKSGEIIKVIEGFAGPRQGIISSVNGAKVYVTNFKADDIRVIDLETMEISQTIAGIPSVRAISVDDTYLYAASSKNGTISVIDATTGEIYKTIKTGDETYGAALSPNADIILAGNKASNNVSVIDVNDDYKVIATVEGLNEPRQAIVYSNNADEAYILNKDLSIAKINYKTAEIIEEIK